MPATYEPIASTTVGSATSSVTFNSIPSTYTDLRLVFIGNCDTASRYFTLRFNSDSSANYSMRYLTGDGSTSATSWRTGDTALYTNNYSGSDTTKQQLITCDIFSYNESRMKTVLSQTASDKTGSGTVDAAVSLWKSTSAITSVTALYMVAGGNIAANSVISLYGIKSA